MFPNTQHKHDSAHCQSKPKCNVSNRLPWAAHIQFEDPSAHVQV